jgi:predicted RNA methylase
MGELIDKNKAMLLKLREYLLSDNYQAINGMIDTLIITDPHVSLMYSVKLMLRSNENNIIRNNTERLYKVIDEKLENKIESIRLDEGHPC